MKRVVAEGRRVAETHSGRGAIDRIKTLVADLTQTMGIGSSAAIQIAQTFRDEFEQSTRARGLNDVRAERIEEGGRTWFEVTLRGEERELFFTVDRTGWHYEGQSAGTANISWVDIFAKLDGMGNFFERVDALQARSFAGRVEAEAPARRARAEPERETDGPAGSARAEPEREILSMLTGEEAVRALLKLMERVALQAGKSLAQAEAVVNAFEEERVRRGLANFEFIATGVRGNDAVEIRLKLSDAERKRHVNLFIEADGLCYRDDFCASRAGWKGVFDNPRGSIAFVLDAPERAAPLRRLKEAMETGEGLGALLAEIETAESAGGQRSSAAEQLVSRHPTTAGKRAGDVLERRNGQAAVEIMLDVVRLTARRKGFDDKGVIRRFKETFEKDCRELGIDVANINLTITLADPATNEVEIEVTFKDGKGREGKLILKEELIGYEDGIQPQLLWWNDVFANPSCSIRFLLESPEASERHKALLARVEEQQHRGQ